MLKYVKVVIAADSLTTVQKLSAGEPHWPTGFAAVAASFAQGTPIADTQHMCNI